MKRFARKPLFQLQFLVLFMLPIAVKMEAKRCEAPGSSGMTMPFHLKHADVCPLQEDILLEKKYNSPIECGLKCSQDVFCVGYNYRKELKKNSNCQLTHKLDHDFKHCSKSDKKWTFYQAVKKREVPCDEIKNCKNGGKTVIRLHDPGSDPYRCECPDGYTGELCEIVNNIKNCKNGGKTIIRQQNPGSDRYICECPNGYTGELCEIDAYSCDGLYKSGERKDGVYTIDPSRKGPFQVRCDMTTHVGGWTVFQRRLDGSVDFYRGWQDYKTGFGDLNGEFWLGLDKIHLLTNSSENTLYVDLTDFDGTTDGGVFGRFTVASESDGYRMNYRTMSGPIGAALSDGMKFSTKDRDNDQSSTNCAESAKGAWWYNGCDESNPLRSNLNGQYLTASSTSTQGIIWYWWKQDYRSMKKAEMKLQ